MSEKWADITANVNSEVKLLRKIGKHEYELVYVDINGDQYEETVLRARKKSIIKGEPDEMVFNREVAFELRKKLIKSVAGEKYKPEMDRLMPAWMRKDLDDFILQYAQGNL